MHKKVSATKEICSLLADLGMADIAKDWKAAAEEDSLESRMIKANFRVIDGGKGTEKHDQGQHKDS